MSDTQMPAWTRLTRDPVQWERPDPVPLEVATDRLSLRPFRPEDATQLFEATDASRETLLPWLPWASGENLDEAGALRCIRQFGADIERPDCPEYVVGIFDRESGEVLGGTGLHHVRPEVHEAETGYWIRQDRRAAGLCTEAVGAWIGCALRSKDEGGWGLRRVVAHCSGPNEASARVCHKLGLRLETRARAARYLGEARDRMEPVGYHDTLGFAVLADEWDHDRHRAKPSIGWPAGAFPS